MEQFGCHARLTWTCGSKGRHIWKTNGELAHVAYASAIRKHSLPEFPNIFTKFEQRGWIASDLNTIFHAELLGQHSG